MGFLLSNNFFVSLLRYLSLGALAFISITIVHSAPLGGQIVGGSGGINQSGLQTTAHQNSSALALEWQSFNINNNETVKFIQPNKNAIVLNRILGNSASQIFGKLDANGQVILVNPNGLFFGDSAVINVGGLLASGLDISPADFLNGDYVFSALEGSEGAVINHGIIQAATGGSVSLLGRQVENSGYISAHLGAVNLVAAKEAVLSFDHDGLVGVKVNKAILQDELGVNPALLNAGSIQAEGGRVLLSASVSQDVFSQAVNNGGLQATSSVVMHEDGSFTLGAGADLINSGSIDVLASLGEKAGGQVVLLGENINHSGEIHADTINTQAGSIELQARDTLLLTENSTISTRAELRGLGGDIKLLGANVGLFDEALVDASGANGGGSVFIGGDREGQNVQMPNSEFIFIGEKSDVYADALLNGNGGKVIAFAEDTARIYGNLFARGGEESGNGGFIETSGLKGFDILSSPDVSASFGEGGLWLIDPFDIDIVDGDNATQFINTDKLFITTPFIADGAEATLHVDLIVEALKNGDVTIKTTSSTLNEDHGNINFNASLNYSGIGTTGKTLTLSAKDIFFADSVSIYDLYAVTKDKLNVTFLPTGAINLAKFTSIITRGGNFTVGNGSITPSSFTSSGTINTSGYQGHAGGNITINTTNNLTTGTLISTGGEADRQAGLAAGNITLSAGNNIDVNGSILAQGSAAERSSSSGFDGGAGGSVTLSSANIVNIARAIDVSGGKGDQRSNSLVSGGNAGSIEIKGASILLGNNLTAIGGAPEGGLYGDGGGITLTGPVTLDTDVEFDTSGNINGDITFNDEIIATGHRGQNLTLTGKEITFVENIAAAGASLGDLNITASGNVNATSSNIFAKSLNINSGMGVSVGSINTKGTEAGTIQITFSDDFKSSGVISAKSTNAVAEDGDITIAGNEENNTFTFGGDVLGKSVLILGYGGDDTFNLYGNVKGPESSSEMVSGGTGNDTFNIHGNITATLKGGDSTDTLIGSNQNNQWNISGIGSGVLFEENDAVDILGPKINFSTIETLQGGNANDAFTLLSNLASIENIKGGDGVNSLQGADAVNTWNITGSDEGDVTGVDFFSGIQTLVGGNLADTFHLKGNISQEVLGNGGKDVFNISVTQNAFLYGNAEKDTFNILNGGISANLSGGKGSDHVIGADESNQWDVTGSGSGSLYQTATSNSKVNFSAIEILRGGSGSDKFKLATSAVIENIIGGAGDNSLQGADINNTWNITSGNAGTIKSVSDFGQIQSLIGGSLADTFNLNRDFVGTVSGNDGADVFNLNTDQTGTFYGNAGDDTFKILAADLDANINGGTDKDLLVAHSVDNQWAILGDKSGKLWQGPSEKVLFSYIESLQGGGVKDNFTLGASGSITQINGGAGINSLTGRNEANTWTIDAKYGGSVNYVANFSGIQNLIGGSEADDFRLGANGEVSNINGGDGANRLKARDGNANTWTISSPNAGSVSNVAGFSDIQSIVGGTGADEMIFEAAGNIDSLIDGGGGIDSLDISKLNSGMRIVLSGVISGKDNTLNVLNVETIKANANNANTIVGDNAANTWTISGANSGNVAPTNNTLPENTTDFFEFANIFGGDLDDTFVMISAGKIKGTIDGGDQQSVDVVDYSQQSNATVDLGLVLNAEKFRGNNQNITLAGSDKNNTWEITANNAGILKQDGENEIYFSDFNFLKGGADTDTFNFTSGGSIGTLINGEMVGRIDGAAGDDILKVNLTGSEQGQINFIGGSHKAGDSIQISGGSENYTPIYSINSDGHAQLDYLNSDNGNNFKLSYQSAEKINDTLLAQSLLIAGGASDDEILLGGNSFSINDLASVSYANKNTLIVNGGDGSDSINVTGEIDMVGGDIDLTAEVLTNGAYALINTSALYLNDIKTGGSDAGWIKTNIENLHIINSSNVYIDELNGINIAQLGQADNIHVSAESITDSIALLSDGALSLNARNGDIVLEAENRLSGRLNLSASGIVHINNLTSTELGDVTANNFTLNSAGDIFGKGVVLVHQNAIFQSPGADINLSGTNDFSRLEIISANSASVNDINTLLIENSQTNVGMNISANGLQVSNVSAGALLNLDAGSGSLAGSGLVAPSIELRATRGVGSGQSPVITRTDTLFAENGTGQININNTGVVTLESLKNIGDITFNNDADIYLKPGSVDAGFNNGTLFLKNETGSFLGSGEANPNNPDITAYAGIFFGLQGTFGTINRPLVLNIQESVLINARSSLSPIFYPNQPRSIDDRSVFQFNSFEALSSVSGDQLVEVETLAEINPAIFTDVRNYASTEIAIRMPRDQLYEDELEEYEE